MTRRFIATLAVVALSASPAAAQSAGTYAAPRTPDGQPDLQGMWNNETLTPFERPTSMADKAFLTEEEAAARNQQSDERRAAADAASEVRTEPLPVGGNIGGYNQFWFDPGRRVLSTRQTSMVVDPPDGRVPVKPWAVAARTHNLAHVGDSYVHMSVWDRCLSRGVPGSMFPAGYNNAYRILQTPDHVTIIYEMIHDVRIIPLDNRPHIDRDIKLWMGNSRAHWDGDTLVVETRNFHNRGWIASSAAGGRIKGIPTSKALYVVERFTRVSDDTIMWDMTVEDPNVYTRPWTVSMPLTHRPSYQMFEYACHEGNWAVRNALSGSRAVERAAR